MITLVIIIILLIPATTFSYYFIAYQELQKKYNIILAQQKEATNINDLIETSSIITKKSSENKLKDSIVQDLIAGIDMLENEKAFLQSDFSLTYIAQALQSNTSYISKVINSYKQCTFKEYVNKLRIQYISNQLKEDSTLLKYSIHFIARSIGYADSSSFSKIFKKHKGVTPSLYIKEIRSSSNNI